MTFFENLSLPLVPLMKKLRQHKTTYGHSGQCRTTNKNVCKTAYLNPWFRGAAFALFYYNLKGPTMSRQKRK